MLTANQVRLQPVPLPATREEMLSRKTLKAMTLNDYVDQIHVTLFGENEEYTDLLDAVYDEDAVHGSLSIDNAFAAKIIRDYAHAQGVPYIAGKKLATIVKSLGVVLRRYHMSRKERAVTIGDEIVTE